MADAGRGVAPEDDYEAYVLRAQRRFRRIVFSLLAALILLLFVPFTLYPAWIKESTAIACTFIAGLLFLAVWRALLTKIGDPGDSADPSPAGKRRHLNQLLVVAGGCLTAIALLAVACFMAGAIEKGGLVGYFLLCAISGFSLARTLLSRAVSSAL